MSADAEIPEAPVGAPRTVRLQGPASLGGAPVAYVVMMAAVIAVLSFIPFSVALAGGSSFPMSQGVYPLTGWLLGPWAGIVASAMGALVGVFLAPHTAGIAWITIGGAGLGAGIAGCIVAGGRRLAGLAASLAVAAACGLFYRHAVHDNGVRPALFVAAYASHAVSVALFLLPTRRWIGRLIASPQLGRVWIGLFLGTWCATGIMMFTESLVSYYLLNWPGQLFVVFVGIIPFEQAARAAIGAVVGTGVIAGLRALSLIKPAGARY